MPDHLPPNCPITFITTPEAVIYKNLSRHW